MGARILLHFSPEALTVLPQIINSYLATVKATNPPILKSEASKPTDSVEETFFRLEEISSNA